MILTYYDDGDVFRDVFHDGVAAAAVVVAEDSEPL
jgi:hypothetical protein